MRDEGVRADPGVRLTAYYLFLGALPLAIFSPFGEGTVS